MYLKFTPILSIFLLRLYFFKFLKIYLFGVEVAFDKYKSEWSQGLPTSNNLGYVN